MANRVLADELEHIEIGSSGSTPAAPERRAWSRRRLALVLATLTIAALAVGPVRTSAVKASFRRMERIYLEARALDDSRVTLLGQLYSRTVPEDEDRLRDAVRRLNAEHDRRLAILGNRLEHDRVIGLDGRLRGLRSTLEAVLSPGSPAALASTEGDVYAVRRALGLGPASAPHVRLHSADRDLAALRRFLDVPTGVRLFVASGDERRVLDIDRSTVHHVGGGPPEDSGELRTDRGLVLQPKGATGPFAIWDATGRTVARYPGWPVAASAHLIARSPSIVHEPRTSTGDVIDATTGAVRYRLPDVGPVFVGVFSPDERFLALLNGASVFVIDLASGVGHAMRYGEASSGAQVAWSPSGDWLFYGTRDIFAWDVRRAQTHQLRLPLGVQPRITHMVALSG